MNSKNPEIWVGLGYAIDPKPDELALARMNPAEMREEVRTGGLFNTFG